MKTLKYFLFVAAVACICSCKKNSADTSNASETADWMGGILKEHPEISLSDIAIPGSHDAGTYIFYDCTIGANTCNTQTQYRNMSEQLNDGIRIFDIRPVYSNHKFYTQHATDCDGFGCHGDLLSNMFTQLASFLDTHREFVMLQVSHFCHSSYDDPAFLHLVDSILGDKIYKENDVQNLPFIHKKLSDILSGPGSKGRVMLLYEDAADTPANRAAGIFSNGILPTEGGWSNSHTLDDLISKQRSYYSGYSNSGNTVFQFSWQITQSDQMAINCAIWPDTASIGELASRANAVLPPFIDSLVSDSQIRKGRIPNIIYVDFADRFITRECLRITKLNLE
jgi:hypothetical protein